MPLATSTLRMPGSVRARRISSTSGPWSVPSSLQIVGCTHESRLHFASTSGRRAAHLVHVRRRAADVADDARELRIGGQLAHFLQHRFLRARLDDPALVGGDRAEGAAAEAAAHDRHRVLDHLVGGDRLGVRGVRPARVRQVVDAVHLLLGQRQRRRVDDDGLAVVELHQGLGVERVGVDVDDARRLGEGELVGLDLLEAGQKENFGHPQREQGRVARPSLALRAGKRLCRFLRPQRIGHAAQVAQVLDRLARGEPPGDLDDRRARPCRRRPGRPWRRAGSNGGRCRSSSRNGPAGAATPRRRRR